MPRGRTVGMTRGSYKGPSIHEHLKQAEDESAKEKPVERKLVEQHEDESSIFNLPDSSSDEESGVQLSDDGPSQSRPKLKSPKLGKRIGTGPQSPPTELPVAPSFIPPITFTSSAASESSPVTRRNSKKRMSRMNEGDTSGEDPFPRQARVKRTYAKGRSSLPGSEKKGKGNGNSQAAKKQKTKKKEAFKKPLQYISHAERSTPSQHEPAEKFVVPMGQPDSTPNERATRSTTSEKPERQHTENGLNIKDPPKTTSATIHPPQFLPPPTSSISSFTPISNYAGSSSSFSSAPDSPAIEASIQDIWFEKSDFREPSTLAKCPVCNAPVERSFLEGFDSGVHLHVRQQILFCKAHRARTAQSEWNARGYPKIDWNNFDKRLAKFHSGLNEILSGKRPSYYRKVYEDHQKSGRNRTLQQCLVSGSRMEALELGYYGSKGGRLMMENIMTNFSHQIRGLGASDKLLASAGVSTFVQSVLTPELAVMLVMQDMGTDEEGARAVLRDSTDIGNLLNEEEDEVIKDPEEDHDDRDGKANGSGSEDIEVEGNLPRRKKNDDAQEEGNLGKDLEREQENAKKKRLLSDILGAPSDDEDGLMIDSGAVGGRADL